ncbi:DUF4350 domain-containing protein [Deinococcus pimensis]|uniref:DUF4350 domain-containing protein n=1 Tax=Deinococcus pimensis TaxID=309888 RepID=UPI000480C9EC|nr:DUF4350 domain-containing protein [Deinococcus pimensis]
MNKLTRLPVLLLLAACGAAPERQVTAPSERYAALATPGAPVINEVYYDSPGTDAGTFVELRAPAGTALSGYSLVAYDTNGAAYRTITLNGTVPASGSFVVAQDTSVPNRNLVNAGVDLYNTSGSLRLLSNGAVVDALAYGAPGISLGEGSPASTAGGSVATSLSRVPDGSDTDRNSVDFRAQATTPGAGNGGGASARKKVLFDLTKREDAGNADWRIDGAYSDWATSLRGLGYDVTTLTGTTITSTALAGASVLVIAEPQNPLSDAERAAISSFVSQGGGLLMISDHRDSDRDGDGWDSPEVFDGWDGSTPASVTSALQRSLDSDTVFGLRHSFASSFSDPVLTATPTASTHPIVTGAGGTASDDVTSAGVYVGTSIDVLSGTDVMSAGGRTYLGVNAYGSGRVAAWGDTSTFSDGSFSDGSTSQYANWGTLSNANLGRNLVRWLARDL